MTGLILAALFAIAQTPSPIPPKALDRTTATDQAVTKNPKNDKAPSAQSPTSVGPSAANQQPHLGSTTKSEDTQQTIRVRELPRVSITKDWSDWGIWALNGLLVIVGAFQLLVLWRQAKIMKAQAEIMAEHAAHLKGLVTAAEDNAKAASAAAEAASKNAEFSRLNAEATLASANAADLSAKTSAKQLELAHRPWVAADIILVTPLTFDAAGMHITIRLLLRNVGNSPAMKTIVSGGIETGWDRSQVIPDMERHAEKLKDGLLSDTMGFTLFPGDKDIPRDITVGLPPEEVTKALDPHSREFIRPTLMVFLGYQFSFADGHHQTRYVFDLKRTNASNPLLPLLIKPSDGNVPRTELILAYHIPGGSQAD